MRRELWNGRVDGFRYGRPADESDMVLITRKIEFSASHLYNNPELSPEEKNRLSHRARAAALMAERIRGLS